MAEQLPLGLQLKAAAHFANFVPGTNTELVAQLQQAAAGQGERFFFCWGSPGCGKTHLLQACCHRAAGAARRAIYVSLRDSQRFAPALLEGWEQFDLVCIDDVDGIAGKPDWQEALFHLYNRIRDAGGTLIVSAAAAPAQSRIELPDLLSRLGWGVVYRLKPLDDTQRLQALQLRAGQKGFELPHETASYLLRRAPRDMPALFDLLERLDEASLAAQRKLTVPFVKSVLGL
jgi:DnaA family protein